MTGKEQKEESEELSGESATSFRALAARANFLAIDRPDMSFAVKELCRGMAHPTKHDEVALKSRTLLARETEEDPALQMAGATARSHGHDGQ